MPVALAVLAVADRTTLLASTLLLVIVALVPYMINTLAFSSRLSFKGMKRSQTSAPAALATWGTLAVFGLVVIGFAPLSIVVAVGGALALILSVWLAIFFAALFKRGKQAASRIARYSLNNDPDLVGGGYLAFLSVCILIGVLAQPWLALEELTVAGEEHASIGYVVGSQGDFTLLVGPDKSVLWISTPKIEGRSLCLSSETDMWSRPLGSMFVPVLLPACEE